MAQKHIIKISNILQLLVDDVKCFKMGENAYESNHVQNFKFDSSLGLVTGEVSASMGDRMYNVQFSIHNGEIEDCACTCPRDALLCHHIAALAIHAHYNVTVTDIECKNTGNDEVITAKSLYPPQHQYVALKKPVTEDQLADFKKEISKVNVGFSWLVAEEPSEDAE